jgi:poly-beta-1,6-N-acetyl-D-glucosamine synthase
LSATVLTAGVSLTFLCYTYFGYPALLAIVARLRPWHPKSTPGWEPTVTVCVASYNSEAVVDAKLSSLADLDYHADKIEFLVYSDGSTDSTEAIVTAWSKRDPRVRLLRGGSRVGKPTAINTMREHATGEVLVISDARQPIDRGAVRALLRLLSAPGVTGVTGNLILDGAAGSGMYWRYENWIRKQESRLGSVMGMTGALSALRRRDLGPLAPDLILDDAWICLHLRLSGGHVLLAEDAIAHDEAFVDEREFGRKVRTLAGNYQLFLRSPRLLVPFLNPSWLEVMSHKIARLFCPWFLLLLLFSCAIGAAGRHAEGWGRAALAALFAAQAGFYALALAGASAGRVGKLARTFVVLNAAAVVGLWRFLLGTQKITW